MCAIETVRTVIQIKGGTDDTRSHEATTSYGAAEGGLKGLLYRMPQQLLISKCHYLVVATKKFTLYSVNAPRLPVKPVKPVAAPEIINRLCPPPIAATGYSMHPNMDIKPYPTQAHPSPPKHA